MSIDRINVLGVGISALTIPLALETMDGWIARREQHYVCVAGVNNVIACQRDPALRHIHNMAGLVTPDGMPMVWLNHLHGNRFVERVYGPDLMLAMFEHSVAQGHRHYFYGGQEGIPERLAERMRQRFPGIQIVGTYTPPWRPLTPAEDDEIVQSINAATPDIVWVGLGAPRQEYWMGTHSGRVHAPVLVGVGAAFDFHTGEKKQAPRWMQRNGLEWLFRLMSEPRRLWRRYLINNPLFVVLIAQQALGTVHYELDSTPPRRTHT